MNNLLDLGLTNALAATVLAIAVWCATRIWRQPPLVAFLWTLVLVKLITPPLVVVPWRFEHTTTASALAAGISPASTKATSVTAPAAQIHTDNLGRPDHTVTTTNVPTTQPLQLSHDASARHEQVVEQASVANRAYKESLNWTFLLELVWVGGSVLWLLIAAVRLTRFHRALRHTEACSDELSQVANEVASKLDVTRRFRLRMTSACLSPFVWPIGRPTIVLSRPLLAAMSDEQTKVLLAHELAHVRRRDHWLRWLEFVATAIYWWHPVVWWSRRMIHVAEEQACDAWVVWAFPESAKRYASALFQAVQMAAEYRSRAPLVASRIGSTGNLKERIEDIMNATWTCRLTKRTRVTLAMFVMLILPLSLRSATTRAEQAAEPKTKTTAAKEDKTDSTSPHGARNTSSTTAKPTNSGAQVTVPAASANQPRVRVPSDPYRVAAGDVLHVTVSNAFADQPIADDYLVEPGGSIALGPSYGRAKVNGMTLEEVDHAVAWHLRTLIENPQVQVTLGGWRNNNGAWAGRPDKSGGESRVTNRKVSADPLDSANSVGSERQIGPEELAALREHVQFLSDRFKTVDALYKTGSKGGSADSRARTAYELASAQAELAAAEGKRTDAIAYCEQAEKLSEETLKSVTASYEAGRVSLDLLLQTAKFASDAKRRLIHLREPQATSTEQQSKTSGDRADTKGNLVALKSLSDSDTSVRYRQAVVEVAKQKYERMKLLADQRVVPAAELELAKAEYEVSIAQLQRAQRTLKYAQLEVDLAETELQEAAATPRTTGGATDDQFEVKKLKIKLEMAKVKASALE